MEEEIYQGEITNHHYLPQYVMMVYIGNRFRNIKGLKWYQFSLFLLYVQKIADNQNGSDTDGGRKLLCRDLQPSLLNSMYM